MGNNHEHHEEHQHHIIPSQILTKVFVALLVLTFFTVLFAQLPLGSWEAPIAFLIAFVKAMLVIMYFMGLKYDSLLNKVIFGSSFLFLFLLLFFCALDIFSRPEVMSTL